MSCRLFSLQIVNRIRKSDILLPLRGALTSSECCSVEESTVGAHVPTYVPHYDRDVSAAISRFLSVSATRGMLPTREVRRHAPLMSADPPTQDISSLAF